jgi:hypothetical protein
MAEEKPQQNAEKTRREERLKAALRENLRRRKAQARSREQAAPSEAREPGPKPSR